MTPSKWINVIFECSLTRRELHRIMRLKGYQVAHRASEGVQVELRVSDMFHMYDESALNEMKTKALLQVFRLTQMTNGQNSKMKIYEAYLKKKIFEIK